MIGRRDQHVFLKKWTLDGVMGEGYMKDGAVADVKIHSNVNSNSNMI